MLFSVFDDLIYIFKDFQRIHIVKFLLYQISVKTGTVACVAGSTHLAYLCKNRIIVTVDRQLLYILEMPTGHTLGPQLLTTSAPVCHSSELQSCIKGLFIHIGEHQHFICSVILYNNRHQSIAVWTELIPGKAADQHIHLKSPVCTVLLQGHKISHFR